MTYSNYDAVATWRAAGLAVPRWMEFPYQGGSLLEEDDVDGDADANEDADPDAGDS